MKMFCDNAGCALHTNMLSNDAGVFLYMIVIGNKIESFMICAGK